MVSILSATLRCGSHAQWQREFDCWMCHAEEADPRAELLARVLRLENAQLRAQHASISYAASAGDQQSEKSAWHDDGIVIVSLPK